VVRVCYDKLLAGYDHCGQAGLHVGSATTDQVCSRLGRMEGVRLPRRLIAGWDYVGMAGEDEQGTLGSSCCPKIIDFSKSHGFTDKTCRAESIHH
jgi:hypothetical protein